MILEGRGKTRNRKQIIMESAFVALIIMGYFAFSLFVSNQKSLTFDEPVHLMAGWLDWRTDMPDINPEHPPLAKRLAALPMALMVPQLRLGQGQPNPQVILFQNQIDVDKVVLWGRGMCLLFAAAAAALTYCLGRRTWGIRGAWIALALFLFCPNLLAHGPLIHTDAAQTLGFVWVVFAAVVYQHKRRIPRVIHLGLALSFALSVKFTAVLLLPYVMINCIVATEKKARVVFLEGLLHFALVLLVCLFALVCVYGSFQGPVDYWQGLNRVYGNHDPRYALFMNGAFRVDGFWLYYPFCLLVKVPLPTILIFLLAIPSWWILRVKQKSFYFHLFFPIFLLLGAGALARHNIGVRHMLPIFPMLFVLAGGVGKFFKPLWTAALMPVFLVWLLLENIKIYPDYMAYFNQGAGGAKNGIHLLDDSNLDWGQDLKRLPALLQNLEIEDFRLAYFGGDHAAYRGMNPKDIRILDLYFPEGDYVVSANILRRNTIDPQYHGYGYDWLERFSPAAVLGHSLYVYRIRVGDAEGFRNGINYISAMQWRQQGFSRLKKLIAENPNFGEAQETLRFAENVFLN